MGPSESRAKTEVSQFNMTGRVDQNVIRLNISVDESHAVDTLNRAGKLSNVKSESWKEKDHIENPARASLHMRV